MTTSRAQAPQVNLKERIAALNQRNVSPGPRPTSPSIPSPAAPNSAGLRDKIAKFEKKGGVPVPRGSFGLGAPPLAENGPLKRRGELYGNRIPGTVRVSGGGPTVSRSGSPFDSLRSFSLSALEGVEGDDADIMPADAANFLPSSPSSPSSPATSFQGLTPQHTGTWERDPSPRGMPFATALEHARRVEGKLEGSFKPDGRESSPAPVPPTAVSGPEEKTKVDVSSDLEPSLSTLPEETPSEDPSQQAAPEIEAPIPSPPSIVLSPSAEPEQEQVMSEVTPPSESVSQGKITSVEPPVPTKVPEPVIEPSLEQPETKVVASESSTITPSISVSEAEDSTSSFNAVDSATEQATVITPDPVLPNATPSSSNKIIPAPQKLEAVVLKEEEDVVPASAVTPSNPSPLSPMGPFTLANAVKDLGQVVANIHDMFPGQISPLAAPPPFRPFRAEEAATPQEPKTPLKAKKSVPDLQIPAYPTVAPPVPDSTSLQSEAVSALRPKTVPPEVAEKATLLATPRAINARPVSMIETSPSHVAVAHRVTPHTSRGVPVFVPANRQQQNFEHFPPTPDVNETEFGTVSMHKPSHSFSHARTYVAHGQSATEQEGASKSSTFTAVVHRKVTETPSVQSSSYASFYSKVPETPQPNRTSSGVSETPMSPGYGELATLLHEAALLELTLEQGELPTEAAPREKLERQQKEKEEKEREKDAAARAKVEEEKRKHEAVAKARAKQESTESKSRSSFRNPMLRSKSSHRRDTSTDTQASRDPTRSKSVLLPFRPQPPPPIHQSTPPIASIPEREVAPAPETVDAEASSQTSPKSPRQYFAGLRRLTSTSRSSTTSATNSRNSVSVSSEMSSEDSLSIPTPPGTGLESAGSGASTVESGHAGIWNGTGITWPSLSPKKSPVARAASFADKMWNRGRTKSTVSTNSPYQAIDRLAKSAAAKSAAALIPPLDPLSFSLAVPALGEQDLPSPPEELVSPRRSASLYVASTSQFPPVYSAKPTSPVYRPLPPMGGLPRQEATQPLGLDSIFSEKLTSPVFTPHPGHHPEETQNLDALFSAKPTSPVYTPHPTQETHNMAALFSAKPTSPVYTPHLPVIAMRSEETITESVLATSPGADSLLPSPQNYNSRPDSWVSDFSMDSSTSSIPSPFFDSFPSVPDDTPLPPALPGRQRNFNRPSLPLPNGSFFEPAPLSSTAVGAEFFSAAPSPFVRSATVRSATLPRISGEHRR
ncbi:hypothetical protein FPV67DRAFT_1647719 [Lyophyllum atratum]|nr:hypothetical protein FPV67DRAFT_1647719 [Lyophyllum atratum]